MNADRLLQWNDENTIIALSILSVEMIWTKIIYIYHQHGKYFVFIEFFFKFSFFASLA
jgi:hypothetical protein